MSELSGGQRRLVRSRARSRRSPTCSARRARGAPRPACPRLVGRAPLRCRGRPCWSATTATCSSRGHGGARPHRRALRSLRGGYSFFLEERPKLMARREKEYELRTRRGRPHPGADLLHVPRVGPAELGLRLSRPRAAEAARARRARVERPEQRRERTLSLSFAAEARGRIMVEATGAEVRYSGGARRTRRSRARARRPRRAVGPNGAGKSTLLAMLAGRQAPTAGKVRHQGGQRMSRSCAGEPRRRSRRTPLEVILEEADGAVTTPCAGSARSGSTTSTARLRRPPLRRPARARASAARLA